MTMLILASNSPRRRALLALGGWNFEIAPADVDETPLPGEPAADYVLRLAQSKAQAAAALRADSHPAGTVILAADTTVVDEGQILGKPRDAAEARQMLKQLRGRTHQVYTAIALLRLGDSTLLTDLCCTDVPMRRYSEVEVDIYIASGDPLDKAGAYAIQHPGFHPVERLRGCYANVVGLPLCHLERTLRKLGLPATTDLPQACQQSLQYTCPVFRNILNASDV